MKKLKKILWPLRYFKVLFWKKRKQGGKLVALLCSFGAADFAMPLWRKEGFSFRQALVIILLCSGTAIQVELVILRFFFAEGIGTSAKVDYGLIEIFLVGLAPEIGALNRLAILLNLAALSWTTAYFYALLLTLAIWMRITGLSVFFNKLWNRFGQWCHDNYKRNKGFRRFLSVALSIYLLRSVFKIICFFQNDQIYEWLADVCLNGFIILFTCSLLSLGNRNNHGSRN